MCCFLHSRGERTYFGFPTKLNNKIKVSLMGSKQAADQIQLSPCWEWVRVSHQTLEKPAEENTSTARCVSVAYPLGSVKVSWKAGCFILKSEACWLTRSLFTWCFKSCEMVHVWANSHNNWANSHYFHCHLIGQLFLRLTYLVFWSFC